MLFSGENVYCRACGAKMRVVGDIDLICDVCGNDGWLDEEDPDYPGEPMQRAGDNPPDDGDFTDGGVYTSWDSDD